MDELYTYMKDKLREMYLNGGETVTLDTEHFRRLYRLTCEMMHISNIFTQEEDIRLMLKEMKGER